MKKLCLTKKKFEGRRRPDERKTRINGGRQMTKTQRGRRSIQNQIRTGEGTELNQKIEEERLKIRNEYENEFKLNFEKKA